MQDTTEFTIQRDASWFHLPWREVWAYRDLLFQMVGRDFAARYRQTVLGPLWFLINPLVSTLVFTVIFGKVAKIPTDRLPPLLFYMSGTVAWGYLSACFSASSNVLAGNAGLFAKVYFPRLVVPLSKAISALINFALQLALLSGFWVYYKFFTPAGAQIQLQVQCLLLPLLIVQMAAVGMGMGLLMSSLTVKYRDFNYIAGFLTSMWFYATPVVYPMSVVPSRWQWLSALNPATPMIELFRYGLLGSGTMNWGFYGISVCFAVVIFVAGVVAFNKAGRTFIDTV